MLAVAAGCGPTARAQPDHTGKAPSEKQLEGNWMWSHAEDRDGVRRLEKELWTLRRRGDAIEGEYRRSATLESLTGTPFECNQHESYELVTVYRVEGRVAADSIELRETSFETTPSPCESNFRKLASYRGQLVDGGGLTLRWKGGSQTLSKSQQPAGMLPRPEATTTGSWRWQNRAEGKSGRRVRVELEQWQLAQTEAGELTGTYVRTVDVVDESGTAFDCNGKASYQYRDRYTVRGSIQGNRVLVAEISVDAAPHACNSSDERHLDTARGELVGDYIVLAWRGRNRQVLRRDRAR